jgi:hypothetical protein
MSIALAIDQLEEAIGQVKDGNKPRALAALIRARTYLARENEAADARVAVAHYTPISAKEVEP